jgi:O-antigen/teichoic acid export membrane protein
MSRGGAEVARNASYSLAANLVAFLAGLVASVVLARLLGPDSFGTYALVLSVGGILAMIGALGVPHAATKYVAEYQARGDRATASRIIGFLGRFEVAMAVGLGAAAFLLAPWLERAFGAPGFAPAFRVAAAGLLPGLLAPLALAGLQGVHDFRRVTLISVTSTLFLLSSTIGLLAAGAGVVGAVAALAATASLSSLLGWRSLGRHLALSLRRASLPASARAKLRRYVPTVSGVLLLDAVVWQRSEVFFLGVFRGPREVAWYALAFGVATTVMRLLPRALSVVLVPVASGLYGAADRPGMRTLFRTGSRYLVILAAPIVVGGAALARPLLTAVYGPEFGPAAAAFPLVLLAGGFGAVGSVTAAIQSGMERQDLVLRVAVAATAVNLALDVALIPRWGLVGAAVANAAAQIGAVVAGIALTAPLVGARFPVRDCLRVLAAAGITGGVAYAIALGVGDGAGLVAAIAAGAAVYPLALLATGGIRAQDLERLRAAGDLLPVTLRPGYVGLLRLAGRWAG